MHRFQEYGKMTNIEQSDILDKQIAVECQMIGIGSYTCILQEKIKISYNGVKFSVPLLQDATRFVTLDVKYNDIIRLLIHFGNTENIENIGKSSIIFIYTTIKAGVMIRELLGMHDPKGPYYHPAGKGDHAHKRITILLDKLPKESQVLLTNLFSREVKKIVELTTKDAYNVLMRAIPKNYQQLDITMQKSKKLANVTIVDDNDDVQIITIYPPPPAKRGFVINTKDYLCLAQGQYLNDVIIDFYLKYLTLEVLTKFDQQRTYVFSSFFYKRLTSSYDQVTESVVPKTLAAKQHARVQQWTKNVNIFEKDFVIIPMNEDSHWYLIIICFPGLVGKVSTCIAKTNENNIYESVQKSKRIKMSTTKENRNEEVVVIENKSQTNIKLKEQEKIVKIPCILIFDSLAATNRVHVVDTLRNYLSYEHVVKFGIKKTFSKDTIMEMYPKVPRQTNWTDCGLYVLQYVESFFKNPIKNYTFPIQSLKTWFEEIVVIRKREEISNLLITLMNNTKGNKIINLPALNFPTLNGKIKDQKSKKRCYYVE
ncbi:sentrin-specific protease 6 isoform X2 [Monomorium pharaonis]|uniref:sentrin-specific protease 6 isoform X2 n=1 Tax=Monomorium pharaonis TaxID=307658 RepID=UPI00063F3B06|nr:sentrin-specific protease 6 isoform X2 [Monomorium pharaonis]